MSILEWLKWRLWGSWHGVSLSAYDERRTSQSQAPGFQIGNIRVPRWLVWLLVIVFALVLIYVVLNLAGFVLTTQKSMSEQATLMLINECYAVDQASGRKFIALDCLVSKMAESVARSEAVSNILGILAYLVSLALAFVAGWTLRGVREKRKEA